MRTKITVDCRLKSKIEEKHLFENGICCIRFNDIDETFWFNSIDELQNFVCEQAAERFYDKELRKGYFLYTNEYNEVFKYYVRANRGKLTVLREEYLYTKESEKSKIS